jgi:hypothetical protein
MDFISLIEYSYNYLSHGHFDRKYSVCLLALNQSQIQNHFNTKKLNFLIKCSQQFFHQ